MMVRRVVVGVCGGYGRCVRPVTATRLWGWEMHWTLGLRWIVATAVGALYKHMGKPLHLTMSSDTHSHSAAWQAQQQQQWLVLGAG